MFWFVLAVLLPILVYVYILKPQKYWSSLGVTQTKPIPLLGDNIDLLFSTVAFAEKTVSIYREHPNVRYYGMYQFLTPLLVVRDPELIKRITVKDFEHFVDHQEFIPDGQEPLWNKNLFALKAVLLPILVYVYILKPHKYWSSLGVTQTKPIPLLGDNIELMFSTVAWAEKTVSIYREHPNLRYYGMYQFLTPILVVRDPELIKKITVKDFEHFVDHQEFIPDGQEPLWNKNLFALKGDKWKHMRPVLSPNFTGSKMKMMFSLMTECADRYTQKLLQDEEAKNELDMRDIMTRFANDAIATAAFGIEVDSYTNKNNKFYLMGKEFTNFTGFWNAIMMALITISPKLCQLLGITFLAKEPTEFFKNLVLETIKVREEQGIVRPDLIHLLMEARKGKRHEDDVADENTGFATVEESEIGARKTQRPEDISETDICAQALIFFFAGFDSVSTVMSCMAYELAVNPDVQDRLRAEILDTLAECGGKVTYDALMKMKYMDMVVSEAMRLWPNVISLDRVCTLPYTIKPETEGERSVTIPKGTIVMLPVFGIHRDPQYYPNPDKFDPERFSEENKSKIKPYTYLPFGIGPRNCIGSRFALMEIKVIFFYLLSKMEFVPSAKTPIPMKLLKTFNIIADPGFYMKIRPLE